jgi:hypothetical protein
MAIAFDTANSGGIYTTGTTVTVSHTSTGSSLIGIVVTFANNGDVLTALTWNSVSIIANQIAKIQLNAGGYLYVHYYIAPPTGAQNVIATVSSNSTSRLEMVVSTYTGAKQSGQPDASISNKGTGLTSISQALTTIANNAWLVMGCCNDTAATFTAGSNTTVRGQIGVTALTDSNSAQTPAGSFSQNVTFSSSHAAWIVLSIAPVSSTTYTQNITQSATGVISLAKIASYFKTLTQSASSAVSLTKGKITLVAMSVAAAANATVTKVKTAFRSLTKSVHAIFPLYKVLHAYRTFSVTATSSVTLAKGFVKTVSLAVSAVGSATMTLSRLFLQSLTQSATAVVSLARHMTFSRALTQSANAVIALSKAGMHYVALSVTATISAALTKGQIFFKTITQVALSSVSISKALTLVKTLSVSATVKIKMFLNGLQSFFGTLFTKRGTSFNEKYTAQGTAFNDKYTPQNTYFQDKYQ